MNRHEPQPFSSAGEARLRYLDSDFQVLSPGTFVRCAITDRPIPLEALRYWSVERQEPYAGPEEASKALERDGLAPTGP